MPRFLTDCVGNAAFCTFGSIQTSALQKPEKYPEMRSAQASFDTRAIMKKFIYVCNVLTLHVRLIAMFKVYSSNMNKL